MPSNVLVSVANYSQDMPGVLATDLGMRSPRMLTIDLSYLLPGLIAPFARLIKPGYLISKTATSAYGRIFPASRAIAAGLTTAPTLVVKDASVFKIGDVLRLGFAGANIGTVLGLNPITNTITLSANASVAVPIGGIVNAVDGGNIVDVYGMVLSPVDLNLHSNDIAAYTSCTVYGDRLPFWSTELATAFPEITFIVPIAAANFN